MLFKDLGLYNKLMLEEMHRKVDGLGRLAIALQGAQRAGAGGGVGGAAAAAVGGATAAKGASAAPVKGAAAAAVAGGSAESSADTASREWGQLLSPPTPAPGPAAPSATETPAGQGAAAPPPGAQGLLDPARNRDRMQNIVCFFVVYAAFKYLVDKDLM